METSTLNAASSCEHLNNNQKNSGDTTPNAKKSPNESVWVWDVVSDIFGNMSLYSFIFITILSFLFTYIWGHLDYCELQIKELCKDFITIFSCILGFIITGYSVILTLNKDIVNKLSKNGGMISDCVLVKKIHKKLSKNRTPYDILSATFSLSCIILMLTILLLTLYRNQNSSLDSHDCLFKIIEFFICVSLFSVFDVIFHLYSVSTYINEKHNRVCKGKLKCHRKKKGK